MGIAKVDTTKKVKGDTARQVCFSKRRSGLMKKAFELSVICGMEIAVVVFSQKGKVFSFAHPEMSYMLAKYRDPQNAAPFCRLRLQDIGDRFKLILPHHEEVVYRLKLEKERNDRLKKMRCRVNQGWWRQLNLQGLTLEQLLEVSDDLQKLLNHQEEFALRSQKHWANLEAQHLSGGQITTSTPVSVRHQQQLLQFPAPGQQQWQGAPAMAGVRPQQWIQHPIANGSSYPQYLPPENWCANRRMANPNGNRSASLGRGYAQGSFQNGLRRDSPPVPPQYLQQGYDHGQQMVLQNQPPAYYQPPNFDMTQFQQQPIAMNGYFREPGQVGGSYNKMNGYYNQSGPSQLISEHDLCPGLTPHGNGNINGFPAYHGGGHNQQHQANTTTNCSDLEEPWSGLGNLPGTQATDLDVQPGAEFRQHENNNIWQQGLAACDI